jgi:UDP-N-acetylmuramate--alanine ligase
MLALLLREAGLHPSMIVGGDIAGLGSGAAWDAEGEWFVVEADESDGTFVELGAEAVVVTSVEPDHLDYYGSEAAMRQAFDRFVAQARGPAVVCADDPGALALAGVARRPGSPATVTYGTSGTADVRVSDVELGRADASFALWVEGAPAGSVSLAVPGLHNVRNAAAAMTMANALGVAWDSAAAAIGLYRGVARRFELRGERDGITFVDDYGHLPSEVAAAIAAARAGGWARIVVVFQPHRYSRTEALWRDFADSFEGADVVVVTDVYPAGEAPRPGVSGELIFAAIRDSHPDADVRYIPTLDAVAHEMARLLVAGDLCLSLGAGDVSKLPDRLLSPGHGVG